MNMNTGRRRSYESTVDEMQRQKKPSSTDDIQTRKTMSCVDYWMQRATCKGLVKPIAISVYLLDRPNRKRLPLRHVMRIRRIGTAKKPATMLLVVRSSRLEHRRRLFTVLFALSSLFWAFPQQSIVVKFMHSVMCFKIIGKEVDPAPSAARMARRGINFLPTGKNPIILQCRVSERGW